MSRWISVFAGLCWVLANPVTYAYTNSLDLKIFGAIIYIQNKTCTYMGLESLLNLDLVCQQGMVIIMSLCDS